MSSYQPSSSSEHDVEAMVSAEEYQMFSEGSEEEEPGMSDYWETDKEFLSGDAGPLVVFDGGSGSHQTRKARKGQDDNTFQFVMNTQQRMASLTSLKKQAVVELAPSASGAGEDSFQPRNFGVDQERASGGSGQAAPGEAERGREGEAFGT